MSQSGLATLRDYIRWAVSQFGREQLFFQGGDQSMFEEARSLVLGSLNLPEQLHDKYLDCNLHADEHVVVQSMLKKRIEQRLPTAYLLGQAWFAGLLFKVNENVAIPYSPLEELIAQSFSPWLIQSPQRILDLYTGSGCVGLACALQFPDAEVVLADNCVSALDLAAQNIAVHGLDERVIVQHSELFSRLSEQRFDLIVCKPPYLSVEHWTQLPREMQYAPQNSAIAKHGGLESIQLILQQACGYLADNGLLVLEVGPHRAHLAALYPDIDFIWLEHSYANCDVLALTAQQCNQYRSLSTPDELARSNPDQ